MCSHCCLMRMRIFVWYVWRKIPDPSLIFPTVRLTCLPPKINHWETRSQTKKPQNSIGLPHSLSCYGNKPAHPTQRAAPMDWDRQTPGRYSPWRHPSYRRRSARLVYRRTCSPSTETPPRTFRSGRRFSICRRRSSGLSREAEREVSPRWSIGFLYRAEH